MKCLDMGAPELALLAVLAGFPNGLVLLGMAWDRRSGAGEVSERVFGKWMTVYLALAVEIPLVFLFVSESVGGSLVGVWSIGFFLVLFLLFLSDIGATTRAMRWILPLLALGCLGIALAGLSAMWRC